jgi:hypothetical protein
LLRRQARGSWLTDWAEAWEPPDPDLVEESLAVLAVRTRTPWDAFWPHALRLDPAQHAATRRKQILQLARYGRFGGGSIREWDDEPVSELRAWYGTLCEVLKEENAMSQRAENQ